MRSCGLAAGPEGVLAGSSSDQAECHMHMPDGGEVGGVIGADAAFCYRPRSLALALGYDDALQSTPLPCCRGSGKPAKKSKKHSLRYMLQSPLQSPSHPPQFESE